MELGVLNPISDNMPFEATLDALQKLWLQATEIAPGGYVADVHCKRAERLAARGLKISVSPGDSLRR